MGIKMHLSGLKVLKNDDKREIYIWILVKLYLNIGYTFF